MYWILQRRFKNDPAFRELCRNLERLEIEHSFCEVIPFSNQFKEEPILPESDKLIFTYGSYTLSKVAIELGWAPGAFNSPNLSQVSLWHVYGPDMFNYDMDGATLKDANPKGTFFMRPMEDTKSFEAKVRTEEEFNEWRDSIAKLEDEFSTVDLDTKVVWCTPKTIEQEVRFFIVDGKVVTYSQYIIGDQVKYSPVVDQYIIDYAQDLCDFYTPDLAYVMDIAVSNDKPKLLECNSINSSGLYAIDTQKFIMAIEELGRKYS